ncbi:MAG: glycosyltransferase [Planctomycetota bacterium]|nr:glycosyltransferase [Planctomycetota bacterium]
MDRSSVRTDKVDPAKFRLAFYSHDGYGLGHFRRSLLLAQKAQEHLGGLEILMVTGSSRAYFFDLPADTRIVTLDTVTKNAEGNYTPRNDLMTLTETLARRRKTLRRALTEFNPDLLVVDHVPTGLRGELLPLLADLKAQGTRLAIGLRDIIDEGPLVKNSWIKDGCSQLIEHLYDHIWVYGNQKVFDLGKLYGLSTSACERIEYLGYLRRSVHTSGSTEPTGTAFKTPSSLKRIVCVSGGGEDGFPIGSTFLETLELYPHKLEGTLITGPFLSRTDSQALASRFGSVSNLQVLRFTTHLEQHLNSADLVVTMGGYNAMMEAISTRKPTVVIPRVFPRKEQWLRASLFASMGLVRCLHPDDLTTASLFKEINDALSSPPPPTPEEQGLSMDGVGNFLSRIEKIRQQFFQLRKVHPVAKSDLIGA